MVVQYELSAVTQFSTIILTIAIVWTSTLYKQHSSSIPSKALIMTHFFKDFTTVTVFPQSMLFHKSLTLRCPSKINDALWSHQSSQLNNNHFCRHKNSIASVVFCPVFHLCFKVRPVQNICTRCLFISNFRNSSSCPQHSHTIFLVGVGPKCLSAQLLSMMSYSLTYLICNSQHKKSSVHYTFF